MWSGCWGGRRDEGGCVCERAVRAHAPVCMRVPTPCRMEPWYLPPDACHLVGAVSFHSRGAPRSKWGPDHLLCCWGPPTGISPGSFQAQAIPTGDGGAWSAEMARAGEGAPAGWPSIPPLSTLPPATARPSPLTETHKYLYLFISKGARLFTAPQD